MMFVKIVLTSIGLSLVVIPLISSETDNVSAAEILTIPADGSTIESSALISGQKYIIEATGVYSSDIHPALPEIPINDADPEWHYVPVLGWIEEPSESSGYPNGILDLLINDTAYDWWGTVDGITFAPHVFSESTRIYRIPEFIGTGYTVKFKILDLANGYWDNMGSLQVTIQAIPEPATLSLLVLGSLAAIRKRKA